MDFISLVRELNFTGGLDENPYNHVAKDELEEDLLQQVMASTLEEELSPPCLDDIANYFSLVEEEVEFQDLEQEVKPETSPIVLK
jgi:hypothetical protein